MSREVDNEFDILHTKIAAYIGAAKAAGLETEVMTTALSYVRDTPERYANDLALAMFDALNDWDVI